MRKFFLDLTPFAFAPDDGAGAGGDDTTDMSAAGKPTQPPLFPEDDDEGDADGGGIAGQLAALPPDQMSQLATALEPDVRVNLAQALIAAMPDEDKLKLDTVPAADVAQNMNAATPSRPEDQYQMSVVRACKRMAAAKVDVESDLKNWRDRVESLAEDGYLEPARKAEFLASLAPDSETRFSVRLEGYGLLAKTCNGIELLEEARSSTATLSKSLLQTRFGGSKPAPFPKPKEQEGQGNDDGFDRKAAEEAGERLARIR